MPGKTRKVRKSPEESATLFPEGTIKSGWVVKKTSNGSQRWVPNTSVVLNGFKLFTVDDAAKNINKPISLYTREYQDMWPTKNAWKSSKDSTYTIYKFVPNGNAGIKGTKKLFKDWLRTRSPEIKKGTRFFVDGPVYECEKNNCDTLLVDGLLVDSNGKKQVSADLLSMEMFVMA